MPLNVEQEVSQGAVEEVEEVAVPEPVTETEPDYAGDVLSALEVAEGEDGQDDETWAEGESEELTDQERQLAAQMTAAVATGGIATGLELVIKGAKISDQQRLEFQQALYPVLAKNDGAMPEWLAKILADWKEELLLARKTVAIGWAIREQVKAERAKEVVLPEEMPTQKQRVRVPKEETTQEAA